MTETRPARTAARYGAVVALAGALITPGAALTGTTIAYADSNLPIGIASDPVATPSASATPSAAPSDEPSKTAEPTPSASSSIEPTKSASSKTANPVKARVTISTEKWREGKIVVRGEGFVSNAPDRGAIFAVKFLDALPDDAHQAINPLTKKGGNSPANFIAIANEDGTFEVEVPLPTTENTGLSAEVLAKAGWATENSEHNVQILSGSLGGADKQDKNYDRGVSIRQKIKLSDKAPEYAPGDAPEPVNASELTDGHGVQVNRGGSIVTVTVPNAEPGTWVYAATYLGNSPQTLYGSGWKRLDGNRSFSYETSVSMPAATYRVVVHNGNQGAENAVLGFADITVERVVAPREDVSNDDQDSYEVEPSLATVVTPAEPIVKRVQAKAKEVAPQSAASTPEAKASAKAISSPSASASPRSNASATSSPTALTAQGPTIEGTELTGMTKWLVNNANNLLLSAAGLVILATALVLRTSKK
ncbi:hypothetical protein [uncultured Rothia sp.]|uniref:hypothetical protein n=1 Tax=Rothia mucilaginosa TaxID=43675 RepID=UPI0025F83DEF|nr:hypothetical protein [uncultured Rothia sp.]